MSDGRSLPHPPPRGFADRHPAAVGFLTGVLSAVLLVVFAGALAAPVRAFYGRQLCRYTTEGCARYSRPYRSPTGALYAREVEEVRRGHLGIFRAGTDEPLGALVVPTHPDRFRPNDLKGVFWSADEAFVAILYHEDGRGHTTVVALERSATGSVGPRIVNTIALDDDYAVVEFTDKCHIAAGNEPDGTGPSMNFC